MKNETLRISACCEAVCYHEGVTLEDIIKNRPVIWHCGKCDNVASTYVKPKYTEVAKGIYRKIEYKS